MQLDSIKNNTSELPHFMNYAKQHGFGELHFKIDKHSGLQAIIAIHNTKRGPALGGCRFIEYPSIELAIQDAMKLAIGMSAKAALANLPLGGGKSVIIKPHEPYDRKEYLHVFGEFVQSLNGQYITALDSGVQLEDMDIIAEKTPFVASRPCHGDPSPSTAYGVFQGIKAALKFKLNKKSVEGVHVAIQGLGHVGFKLAEMLHQQGAILTVADIDSILVEKAVKAFSAKPVSVSKIHGIDCDVFAPCALGGVVNDNTIHEIKAAIIAGAANNQLLHTHHGQILHQRGILYATDYVINSGGLIFATCRYYNTSENKMKDQLDYISIRLTEIFERSESEGKPTNIICDALVNELLS